MANSHLLRRCDHPDSSVSIHRAANPLPVFIFYCLSGFVSLGYQVAWFGIYVEKFGSTNLTFALVLCNFIGGIGAGALASRWVAQWLGARLRTSNRLRVYGVVELLVAVSVLLTFAAGTLPADLWGTFPYRASGGIFVPTAVYQWSKLLVATLCIFVPCFFMGVTFPLLCDSFRSRSAQDRFPAALYGWNTLGACLGVLVCQFILLPQAGHNVTLWFMAALNLAIGTTFLCVGGPSMPARSSDGGDDGTFAIRPGVLLICAIVSGLVAGSLEGDMFKRIWFLGGTRAAAMSFISFWAILAIFLGSWTVKALPRLRLFHIKVAFAAAAVGYVLTWRFAYPLRNLIHQRAIDAAVGSLPESQLGTADPTVGVQTGLVPLLLFVGVFVFPAYYLISLLLPYVCTRLHTDRRHLGLAYGANTLAFCVGIVGFTWVAPRVNVFYSMRLLFVLLAIATVLLFMINERRRLVLWKPVIAAVAFAVACAVTSSQFDRSAFAPQSPPALYPVRALRSNAAHTTYVVATPTGDRLYFDGHSMSGTSRASQSYMRLMAHFPLLAHPEPRSALLIGFGVGNTASAIAAHDTIRSIDVVDLNDNVIATAPQFAASNDGVYLDPRVRFIHDDGRNYLRVTDRTYDLITSEPPPPMMSGIDRLYSVQYYRQVLDHLTSDGFMTQWLPIYQMPQEAVDRVAVTFVKVFPHTLLFTGFNREYILIGSRAAIDLGRLERRFARQKRVARDLQRLNIQTPLSLIARIVKGDRSLRRDYESHRVIRDQRNDLAHLFSAPGRPSLITYDPIAMLADIGADRLVMAQPLRSVVTHLGRLQYHVPDFPTQSMMSVPVERRTQVALAAVDWRRVGTLLARSGEARQVGSIAAAQQLLAAALSLADEQPRVLFELAHLHLRDGRYGAALPVLDQFVRIEPDEAIGHVCRGMALAGLRRYDDAVATLRVALRLAPDNADAHNSIGSALASMQRIDEAIIHFREAVKARPDFARACFNLASALEARNRVEEAMDHYRNALTLAETRGNEPLARVMRNRMATAGVRATGDQETPR